MNSRQVLEILASAVRDPDGFGGSLQVRKPEFPPPLVHAALDHGVSGSLALAARAAGLAVPEAITRAVEHARLVHLQTRRALASLAVEFARADIPWAVVKGPALARLWEHASITRTYSDLDVLVSPSDLATAVAMLEDCGFVSRCLNWSGFIDQGVAEVPFDNGTVIVDLHWNVVALASQRRELQFDTDAMLSRCTVGSASGVDVPLLDPLDTFAHTCCHAGLAGARTLRQLRDVHLSAGRVPVSAAKEHLAAAGVSRLASAVVSRAIDLFGPVAPPQGAGERTGGRPALAERDLGHPTWVAINRAIDRLWIGVPAKSQATYPGGFVNAGRDSLWKTLAMLRRAPVIAARTRLGLPTIESEGGPLDWDHRNPLDSREGRAAYFNYVAAARH